MIDTVLAKKVEQTQKFLENGKRIPVTRLFVGKNAVITHKTKEKDGYMAVQLGLGTKKHPTKALLGHIKGAHTPAPSFLREVRVTSDEGLPAVGEMITAAAVFQPGDIIDVIGTSKGKGYAGVVKRHNFKGGPRTHGQSDRERAPGSIGQTTTPGRVYKGKRMAGRMGHERVTVENLQVVAVTDAELWIKGLVPGVVNSMVMVKKVGEDKKFAGLHAVSQPEKKKEDTVQPVTEGVEQVETTSVVQPSDAVTTPEETVITPAEEKKEEKENGRK